jgi:hypothetical protein
MESRDIIAYQIHEAESAMQLQAAPFDRQWMDESPQRFAYRCLPLNIANQSGWMITCPVDFRAYWYGTEAATDLEISFDNAKDNSVMSHFGSGVITFSLPYLFRTPPGINIWAKGPSNWPKDGVQALEGVIETDWNISTFTMNWKMTRANEWVEFKKGEPICMLVPVPRGFAETLLPRIELLKSNPELQAKYLVWEASRSGFLTGLKTLDPDAVKRGWQKDYFQGKTAEGGAFEGHQTRLNLKEFEKSE